LVLAAQVRHLHQQRDQTAIRLAHFLFPPLAVAVGVLGRQAQQAAVLAVAQMAL